ncbi:MULTISPECIES: hypothetical protein [unclassified Sphingomonas]|uniref:hypothetical protein n=1 Tax=unclassified Sphingomonas TaxID=196159 RepID=UPI000701F318|nr:MULTISPECIES: hypothetical protein [unclassified Sphingomonas]KQM62403.1 hypothetical protein ASE65_05300 [Sphingomonas sp. Leaf16]KQN13806.1 hypothetical protein ASE81_05370 [Sphingomonas sp. Leaf29]KQN22965.1 hypothetical protein ASE83_00040 [Sphingomonas sp. Leaf32]
MTAVITAHAIARWQERIQPRATIAQAIAAIHAHDKAIARALAFGAPCVRTSQARLILRGGVVATVYPKAWILPPLSKGGAL